eukprot:6917532-Prymnesium_polylepis.1
MKGASTAWLFVGLSEESKGVAQDDSVRRGRTELQTYCTVSHTVSDPDIMVGCGDLNVSMSISQQGGFAGATITLSISSLGAHFVSRYKNSVFLHPGWHFQPLS